ncbi:HAMP domain-containing histidine kinase [Hymenobacter sp. BT188]|uniref:sensor histidine kinase n=1 Tax=Hymenobacter sp. BT188 TaxID=2763504 RepID=UPI00165154A5|nr:HAMP domain-containing sensor histidine kinase [Hymenobacter sp. BT188]MBC6607572.1 HAMP domain-containing histidine kinase [Hymenobacter sp. BT188]
MDYLQLMPAVWRLRFPKDTETDFIQHYEETNIRTIKISLAFGFVLYSSFGILDIFSAPNSTATAWFYRFGIGSPTLLLIVIITHIKALRSYLQQIISGGCIVAAITVSLIIKKTDPSELAHTHYYVGLIIIMMFTGSWARLKFWYAFVSNTLIISIYFVVLVTDGHSIHNRLLIINNGMMLLSAHFVSALTCYFFEVNSRIDFLQRRTIEAEKNKSNAQREELEQQAEQLADALNSLENTQAQLVQREKMASLGELTAGIAHEIQNPLNFVNNFAEVSTELAAELQAEAAQPEPDLLTLREAAEDLRQNQERIQQHGRRAANIVRDMLAHARANSGARVPTDLNALADEHLHLAYHSLRAKDPQFNAALTTHFDPSLGAVEAIPEALSRVMVNLFNNAFYALQQRKKTEVNGYRPEVQVYTHRTNGHVEVRVRDNGPGIPAPIRDKIFQPFFTTKPSGEGTGLGLSLSYDIITQGHGGTLTVDSQEGEFTEFTIELPQSSAPEKAPQPPV